MSSSRARSFPRPRLKGAQFLVPALLRTLIFPPLLAFALLTLLPDLPSWLKVTAYVSSVSVVFVARSAFESHAATYQARALGAVDVPRVHGKWLLNLDVLRDWARSGSADEVAWMMRVMANKYGMTFNTRVLGEDQIVSMDPVVIKHVLIGDFDNFVKGAKFKDRAKEFLGDGIFNSDGDRWKFHRTLTRPFFHPKHVNAALFVPFISRFLASLPSHTSTSTSSTAARVDLDRVMGEPTTPSAPFDIQLALGQLSLEMAIMWMCGEDIGLPGMTRTSEWRAARDALGDALTTAQRVVGRRVKIGTVWPLFELTRDPLKEPMYIIRTFFSPLITDAQSRKAARLSGPVQSGERFDQHLIDMLVDATDEPDLVLDQLINVLLAARDTTSALLTFSIYIMALMPEVMQRIREEVSDIAKTGNITSEVVRDSKISRAFINEVLRLFPPLPINIRRSVRPALLPTSDGGPPLYMPANTSIILAILLVQRSTDVWGPDAHDFNLDRWLGGDGLPKHEREAFMAWSLGPRMCLGQPMALNAAHTFLVLLIRHLDSISPTASIHLAPQSQPEATRMPAAWQTVEGGEGRARGGRDRVWVVSDVVLAIRGGLWVWLG